LKKNICPNCEREVKHPTKIWQKYYKKEVKGEKKTIEKRGIYKELCPYCGWTLKQKKIPVKTFEEKEIKTEDLLEPYRKAFKSIVKDLKEYIDYLEEEFSSLWI